MMDSSEMDENAGLPIRQKSQKSSPNSEEIGD